MDKRTSTLYSASAVRAMDSMAIEQLGIAGYELMTRAAQAALQGIAAQFDPSHSVCMVCGAGNNAGDGYVLARLMLDSGWPVTVLALVDPDKLQGDAHRAHADLVATGHEVHVQTEGLATEQLDDADIIVDALLGTGMLRPLEGSFLEAVALINQSSAFTVSLDIPTGLSTDEGVALPIAVAANMTVSFVALKSGLFLNDGLAHRGTLVFNNLGIPSCVTENHTPVARLTSDDQVSTLLGARRVDAHKGRFGRVLIVGGGKGMPGAAILAGSAALRAGAGVVKIACHPDNVAAIVSARPELMCHAIDSPEALEPLMDWCTVLGAGPGLGHDSWADAIYKKIHQTTAPQVLDADALTLLSRDTSLNDSRILTPHPGEAATLLSMSVEDVQKNRLKSAQAIARRYGGVVILKGSGTIIRSAQSDSFICDRGNPGMATAGAGDVLTGVACAMLAQASQASLLDAAVAAVHVHASAGDIAAATIPRGMVAGDMLAPIRRCVN